MEEKITGMRGRPTKSLDDFGMAMDSPGMKGALEQMGIPDLQPLGP